MPTTTGRATDFITFTRTSNATVTDSNGFIKWAGHNLLTNSESFDASAWGKGNVTASGNTSAAPNGTTTADTIAEDGALNFHYTVQSITTIASAQYTASVFMKAGTQNFGIINVYNNSTTSLYAAASFNLSTGAVVNSAASGTGYAIVGTPTITPVGSGWYLCSVTFTNGTTGANFFSVALSNNGTIADYGMNTYTGTSKTILAWGAHLYRSDLGGMVLNPARGDAYYPTTPRNLLGYTESLTTGWTNTNTTDSIVTETNPNGLASSVEVTATAGNGTLLGSISLLASPYTFSIWLKRKTGTGTVEITVDGTTYVAAAVTGTWTRFSTTLTPTAGTKTPGIRLVTSGDAVYAWGAQLSDSASLDAYSPVYGAAVTSAAYYAPRLDFNANGSALGLLVEEQRTNLVLNSAAFDDASWSLTNATISANVSGASAVAPDGTNTADKLAEDNNTGTHRVFPLNAITVVSGSTYTYSIYAKAVERTRIQLVDNDIQGAIFDLSNGTVSSPGTGVTALPPVAVGNGWYRCSMTRNAGSTAGRLTVYLVDGTGSTSYAGVTGNGVLLWGAQLELGSFATSYIPTIGASTATRTADVASVSTQAFPYSATEGTIVVQSTVKTWSALAYPTHASLNDATASNVMMTFHQNNGLAYTDIYTGGGPAQFTATYGNLANGQTTKMALAYKTNDAQGARDGTVSAVDNTVTVPSVTRLEIGAYAGIQRLNGHIRQITYIPRRLSSSELQARTL